MVQRFYDELASVYHLLFEDWSLEIQRQGRVLRTLLRSPEETGPVLDVACGIGTQVFGLAAQGFVVEGSDLSPEEIRRAQKEAADRGLMLKLRTDDMRHLSTAPMGKYGALVCMGNSIAHLPSEEDVLEMLSAARLRLRRGGTILISLRDYARALAERRTSTPPAFFGGTGHRRIVHHVWDWIDDRNYVFHVYLTTENNGDWRVHHFVGSSRAITPSEVASLLEQAGYQSIQIHDPEATDYYQVIVAGQNP